MVSHPDGTYVVYRDLDGLTVYRPAGPFTVDGITYVPPTGDDEGREYVRSMIEVMKCEASAFQGRARHAPHPPVTEADLDRWVAGGWLHRR